MAFTAHLAHAASPLVENPDFSQGAQTPWLIMISQAGCGYCERLERTILQPLRASNQYTGRIQFGDVSIDRGIQVRDFAGQLVSGQDFAARYSAYGTPTLLFLDATGQLLSEPQYGVPQAIDFYGFQIESTLDAIAPPDGHTGRSEPSQLK